MKTFKRIIYIILGIITFLLIIAYLLPKTWRVERSVSIHAGNQVVFSFTGKLNRWDLWTPWTKESDSTVKYTMEGPDGQIGSIRKWDGKTLGNGEIRITGLVPGKSIRFDVSFNHGKFRSAGMITCESSGDSCLVTWIASGSAGYNPVERYFSLMMDHMMGGDFEKALLKLKKVAEEHRSWPGIEEKILNERFALIVRDSAGPSTYPQVFGKAYGEIMKFMGKNKLQQTGSPFAIYLKWDSVTRNSVLDMGIPVDRIVNGTGRVRFEKIPATDVVMAYYFGNYDNLSPVYRALERYISESGKNISGNPGEIYITDPMTEKDTSRWETDIYYPVK
jgi:effector-binding domain-containing protein